MKTTITTPNQPEVEQISYNFPTYNVSFMATSQEEAEKKLKEWLESQNKPPKTEIKTPNLSKKDNNQ